MSFSISLLIQIEKIIFKLNSQTRLRKVYLHDRASFQEIARAAYYQNYFDHWNTKAGVDQYIEEQFGTARLKIELVDPTIEYNFIEYKGEVAGFTKLNLSPKEHRFTLRLMRT